MFYTWSDIVTAKNYSVIVEGLQKGKCDSIFFDLAKTETSKTLNGNLTLLPELSNMWYLCMVAHQPDFQVGEFVLKTVQLWTVGKNLQLQTSAWLNTLISV